MGVRAIDVSRWQGAINWGAVRGDGVRGAWIKVAGADGSLYTDAQAANNLAGAEAAGVPFGTYYFCSPGLGTAITQARHAVQCGHGRGQLWPMADLEGNPNRLSREQYDRWASDFCAEVQRLTGRESIVYTYSGAGLLGYTAAAPRHCRLWIANYGTNSPGTMPPPARPGIPPAWSSWSIWQFNSATRVAGIPANTVDQNTVTDQFWAEMTGAQPAPPPTPEDLIMKAVFLPDEPPGQPKFWQPIDALRAVALEDPPGDDPATDLAELAMLFAIDAVRDTATLTGHHAELFKRRFHRTDVHTVHWGPVQLMVEGVKRVSEELAKVSVSVDAGAIAAAVAEHLQGSGSISAQLTDTDVARIATAVADEGHRRSAQ